MALVSPLAASAASGDVVTVVGTPVTTPNNATPGFSADGTPATSASVSAPQGIAVDSHGDIFFADTVNAVVRMVPAKTGTYFNIPMTAGHVYTIAGTNPTSGGKASTGFSGSGGPATQALLSAPKRVTLDANGDVIFSDNGNEVVQVIAAHTGTLFGVQMTTVGDLYTIAGPGSPAGGTFSDLHGVALDSYGNLIITDTGNERVQLLSAAAGTYYGQTFTAADQIATIAGNGTDTFVQGPALSSGLSSPHDTVVDPTDGNLVIADYLDSRIIVLAKSTGSFDGIAMTAGDVYDLAGSGATGSTDGPAASASFYYPNAVALDSSGNVVVADVFNNEIRVVAEKTGTFYGTAMTAGNVYTIAGSNQLGADSGDGGPPSAAGFGDPSDVAVDSSGNIFVTEGVDDPTSAGDGNRIRELEFGNPGTPAPGPPGTPVATAGDASVQLSWTAPTVNGGGAISDYIVNVYNGSGTTGTPTVKDTKSTSGSFTVSGLTDGQAYTFTIQAVNSGGSGTASGSVTATPTAPVVAPGAPGDLTANPGDGTAQLSWTAPKIGNSPTNYVIDEYTGPNMSGPATVIDIGSSDLQYLVKGLTDGQSYTFTVTASNAKGPGPASKPVTTEPVAPPGAPGTPTVTAGYGSVSLTWTAPVTGGPPADYVVDVYSGSTASGQPRVVDLNGIGRSSTIPGLVDGQVYTFTIVASNTSGSGPASKPVTAVPEAPVSPPPVSPPPVSPPPVSPPPVSPPPVSPPTTPSTPTTPKSPSPGDPATSYWLFASDGGVFSFGGASFYGSLGGLHLVQPVVGAATVPGGHGYYMVASDGGVFTFGDARFYGSLGGVALNQPIVAMAVTPSGRGYWLFARDGGVFAFGDAPYYGSLGGVHLTEPIVGAGVTPGGRGYYMVASDGGVFTFGDAGFFGSLGDVHLNQPIVAMACTPGGGGYWLFARDGGVFAFGDAGFYGSLGGVRSTQPIVTAMATASGRGYYLIGSDGGVFTFGDAPFDGSLGSVRLNRPIVAGSDLPFGH